MKIYILLTIAALSAALTGCEVMLGDTEGGGVLPMPRSELSRDALRFMPVLDTIYVLGDTYIEISLKEQRARLYKRDGFYKEYKISTGNAGVKEGIATRTGIFTVQSKSTLAISKLFDDAKMFHWVGFDGNIGFHGLEGRGYYWSLGVRPSSHGCVRIGREDAKDLYSRVKIGAPVMVYSEKPARVFKFAKRSEIDMSRAEFIESRNKLNEQLLNLRLDGLYKGYYYKVAKKVLVMDGATKLKPGGFAVGSAGRIAPAQDIPLPEIERSPSAGDALFLTRRYRRGDDSLRLKEIVEAGKHLGKSAKKKN
ncbi:MAG: L,D-transpeptidase [Chloroflexota bacterium]